VYYRCIDIGKDPPISAINDMRANIKRDTHDPAGIGLRDVGIDKLCGQNRTYCFANSVAGMGSCNKNNLMSKSIWVPRPVATSAAAGSPRYKASVACGPKCAAMPWVLKPAFSKTSTNSGASTCNGISGLSGRQNSVIYSSFEESGDGDKSSVVSED